MTESNEYKNKSHCQNGRSRRFYGDEINIYQFQQKDDLKLTLAHELGHYLGFEHVSDSKAIMHYLIGDQDMKKLTLSPDDSEELSRVCKIE